MTLATLIGQNLEGGWVITAQRQSGVALSYTMEIETRRLYVRPYVETDLPDALAVRGAPVHVP